MSRGEIILLRATPPTWWFLEPRTSLWRPRALQINCVCLKASARWSTADKNNQTFPAEPHSNTVYDPCPRWTTLHCCTRPPPIHGVENSKFHVCRFQRLCHRVCSGLLSATTQRFYQGNDRRGGHFTLNLFHKVRTVSIAMGG